MAVRSADLRIGSPRRRFIGEALTKLACAARERSQARSRVRSLMAEQSAGRETGARI